MKQLWVLTLFFATGLVGKAQTYHPFPMSNTTWSEKVQNWNTQSQLECWLNTFYGLTGDTLINGNMYAKLSGINPEITFANYINVYEFIEDSATYIGAIREDSSKKVYCWLVNDTAEIVVFDFGLQTGDTFYMKFNSTTFPPIPYILNQIDSVDHNGLIRKQFSFAGDNGTLTWVEGIGNLSGWFKMPLVGTTITGLSCVEQDGVFIYGDSSYCSCTPEWLSSAETLFDNKGKLFPNPVSDELVVQPPKSTLDVAVYNSLGQQVFQSQAVHQNQLTIDVSTLPNGVYYLMLKGSEFNFSQIFVKQ